MSRGAWRLVAPIGVAALGLAVGFRLELRSAALIAAFVLAAALWFSFARRIAS